MITLYESILRSTKSGKDVFKPKYITGWSGQQIWQVDSDMKVWFENCDIEKFEVNNPLAKIEISKCGDFDIERIKNTKIQKLHVDYTAFIEQSLFEEYKTLDGILYTKMPKRFEFTTKQSNKIENLIKDNDIKELRYRASKEDSKPLSQYSSYPIEKYNGVYSIPKSTK